MMKKYLLILMALGVGAIVATAAENLLKNPEFTSGTGNKIENWTPNNNTAVVKITPDGLSVSTSAGQEDWLSQTVPVFGGRSYAITVGGLAKANVKVPNTVDSLVFFQSDSDGWLGYQALKAVSCFNPKFPQATVAASDVEVYRLLQVKTPDTAAKLGVRLNSSGQAESLWSFIAVTPTLLPNPFLMPSDDRKFVQHWINGLADGKLEWKRSGHRDFLTVNTVKGGFFYQEAKIDGSRKLTVAVRLKTTVVVPDAEHTVAVGVFFKEANDKWIGYKELKTLAKFHPKYPDATVKSTDKYETVNAEVDIPANAGIAGVRIELTGPVSVDFDYAIMDYQEEPKTNSGTNLLLNSDFKTVNAQKMPTNWTLTASDNRSGDLVVSAVDGVASVDFKPGVTGRIQSWMAQELPAAGNEKYTLSLKCLTKILDSNAEFEVNAGVYFFDADGKWLEYQTLSKFAYRSEKFPSATLLPTGDWQSAKVGFVAPPGAVKMGIRLNVTGPGCVVRWSDVRLTAVARTVTQTLNAIPYPASFPVNHPEQVTANNVTLPVKWQSDDQVFQKKNSFRQEISLNGLWAYASVNRNGVLNSEKPWAYLKIPGCFKDNRNFNVLYDNIGQYDLRSMSVRWLFRTFTVPNDNGKKSRYSLRFDALPRSIIRVFCNGKAIGDLSDDWGGELEIPQGLLSSDQPNQLAVLAIPKSSSTNLSHLYAAGKPRPFEEIKPYHDSAIYDVTLVVTPANPVLDGIRITPDYRHHQLKVSIPQPPKNDLSYDFCVSDITGKILLSKTGLKGTVAGKRLELVADWPEPVLWTPDTPNLLELTVSARIGETVVDQSLPQRFGFREVWRDGKKLYLNGQELRLRPRMSIIYDPLHDVNYLRRGLSFYKDMGFNTILRLSDMQETEEYYHGITAVNVADELGIFFVGYLPYQAVTGGQFFNKSVVDADPALIQYIDDRIISRYWNHPSVIAYSGFGTSPDFGEGLTYANSPDRWGIAPLNSPEAIAAAQASGLSFNQNYLNRLNAAVSFVRQVKELDSSRLFLSHYDCGVGDGWGIFDYFNWTPVQEWEDWVANYPVHGIIPIGSWEHGLPYPMSFVSHAIPDGDGEPWATEYAAIYLGPHAYELETPEYLEFIRKSYRPSTGAYGATPHYATGEIPGFPQVQAVWELFNTRIYRSWRLLGVNMGIEPFGPASDYVDPKFLTAGNGENIASPAQNLTGEGAYADRFVVTSNWVNEAAIGLPTAPTGKKPDHLTPLGNALYANNRDLLGFVAGAVDNPTAKDHIFAPGMKVKKSVALIYDGFTPKTITLKTKVIAGDRELSSWSKVLQLSGSENRIDSFDFVIPRELSGGTLTDPIKGLVELDLWVDDQLYSRDCFAFSVIDPANKQCVGTVLFDPEGTAVSLAVFAQMTVKTTGELAASGAKVAMVAPNAFTPQLWQAAKAANIRLLVLNLTPEALEGLGMRSYPARSRQFWPDNTLPVDAELLRDWNAGTPLKLGDKFMPLRKGYNNISSTNNLVAQTVIETPQTGNFTPLMHGEFDLAMTPLLQGNIDGIPVIFSQLEFESNTQCNPAAGVLLVKVLEHLKSLDNDHWFRPAVLGDVTILTMLGAEAPKNELPERGAVLAAGPIADPAALKTWVESGHTAIILPQPESVYQYFGVKITRGRISYFSTDMAGINAGNTHFRQPLDVVLFANGSPLTEQPLGKGKMVLLGIDPRELDVVKFPYLNFTQKRLYRLLSQMLTNEKMALVTPGKAVDLRLLRQPVNFVISADTKAGIRRTGTDVDDGWTKINYSDSDWGRFVLRETNTGLPDAQLRLLFELTPELAAVPRLALDAGSFDDFDEIYLNGVLIGKTTPDNADPETAWSLHRNYPLPENLLKPGKNLLAIHTWNRNGTTKNWSAQVRGPLRLVDRDSESKLYTGVYRHRDDPYLLHQW